ncbi:MAG TPA: hypothetical protein VGH64_00615 [Puia sp.]
MKKVIALLLIALTFSCGTRDQHDQSADTAIKKSGDTSMQQQIPQTPVSADSAGARKEQEKSSMDTVRRP